MRLTRRDSFCCGQLYGLHLSPELAALWRSRDAEPEDVPRLELLQCQAEPEDDADRDEVGRLLMRAADERIPPRGALVLHMRYGQGMTFAEIGERLGVTRERARQLDAKALRRLRDVAHSAGWRV